MFIHSNVKQNVRPQSFYLYTNETKHSTAKFQMLYEWN